MRVIICLIADKDEERQPTALAEAMRRLRGAHAVRVLDLRQPAGFGTVAQAGRPRLADLYLLKSRSPRALEVALHLERLGAQVVNRSDATRSCQDRVRMTARVLEAGAPCPQTWACSSLQDLLANRDWLAALPFPLVVKSRYSRRGDLVARAENARQLQDLAAHWACEPVVLQEFVDNDRWDLKLWVIGQQVFAARRRSKLGAAGGSEQTTPLELDGLPDGGVRLALEIGRAFGLRLYGVDLLVAEQGPVVIDVNSFPGCRGVLGAGDALVRLVEHLIRSRGGAP